MDHLDDASLVEQVLENGNLKAFEVLVKRYQKQVYSLAYRLTNNRDDAEEMAQEVFLRIYQVLERYDPERQFFSWMYKIALNTCYTFLRKSNNAEETSLENVIEFSTLVPAETDGIEAYLEKKEESELVQKALSELPEKYRVPLVLHYLRDLSYREIAKYMEVPVTTVETRIYRGKMLLAKRLAWVMQKRDKDEMSGS